MRVRVHSESRDSGTLDLEEVERERERGIGGESQHRFHSGEQTHDSQTLSTRLVSFFPSIPFSFSH